MPRERREYPIASIATSLGEVQVSFLGRDQATVEARRDHPITVNRVAIAVSLRLGEYGAGFELSRSKEGQPDYNALRGYRSGPYEPSPSARRRILDVIPAAVQAFGVANPAVLRDAELAKLNNQAVYLELEIADLEKQLGEKRAELNVVEARERGL